MRKVMEKQLKIGQVDISNILHKVVPENPEVLDEINHAYSVVVTAGHNLFRKEQGSLRGRCDSFVVETDVHYPTDINLLWDAIRKVIELIDQECEQLGITEWRQRQHILRKIKLRSGCAGTTGTGKKQLKLLLNMFYDVWIVADNLGLNIVYN